MKVRVSPWIIPLVVISVISGNYKQILFAYICITIHELAHCFAAMLLGMKGKEIVFSPFGAHLTLSGNIMVSVTDAVILYSAGPLINGLLGLVGVLFNNSELYRINFALMAVNLIPLTPLDGGMILRRILSDKLGIFKARRIMNAISFVAGCVALIIAVVFLISGHISYSLFVLAAFMIGNAFTGNGLYEPEIMRAAALNSEKIVESDKNL